MFQAFPASLPLSHVVHPTKGPIHIVPCLEACLGSMPSRLVTVMHSCTTKVYLGSRQRDSSCLGIAPCHMHGCWATLRVNNMHVWAPMYVRLGNIRCAKAWS